MKNTFTSFFALFIAYSAFSQITHTVNSGNFYYDPEVLTITVGDDVNWINDGGFHNVNADVNTLTGSSYGNPESFISSPTNSSDLYTHTFTIAGTYGYDCSVGSHAANGMIGTIIVEQGTSNVNETAQERLNRTFHVFQSGYSNTIYVQFDARKNSNHAQIQITGLDGKEIFNQNLNIEEGKNVRNITLKEVPNAGIYIVNLFAGNSFVSKKISIQ
jgi:plastocyanin